MVVASGIVDVVDGIYHIHYELYRDSLVGTKYNCSLTVVADSCINHVHELGFFSRIVVNKILVLIVDVYCDALLGHSLTAA